MTLVAEAERVLAGVRVPSAEDFADNASDWLEAPELEELATDMVGRWPEFAHLVDVEIRYAWKRERVERARPGTCKRLGKEARYLASRDAFVTLAADRARERSGREIEAALYHELARLQVDAKGKLVLGEPDVALFFNEVRRFGAWHPALDAARQVFEQIALPL